MNRSQRLGREDNCNLMVASEHMSQTGVGACFVGAK